MARMYFSFKTNLRDTDYFVLTPQIEYIAFENKESNIIISVGCNESSDYRIKTGRYDARFKGLECKISSLDGEEIIHEYQDISEDDIELLRNAVPYEVGVYFPSLESTLDEPVTIEDLNISIEYGEKELQFQSSRCNALEYGEDIEEERNNNNKEMESAEL